MHYPTDIGLLNDVREALEEIIDVMHQPYVGTDRKPRAYRNCARKDYLNLSKKKRPSVKAIRKAIGKQLRYIRRDLSIVGQLAAKDSLPLLNKKQYRNLLVSQEIYTNRKHQV